MINYEAIAAHLVGSIENASPITLPMIRQSAQMELRHIRRDLDRMPPEATKAFAPDVEALERSVAAALDARADVTSA